MHIKPVHAERDVPTLRAFVADNPLGLFTTAIPNPKYDTIQTSHVPFIIDEPNDTETLGTLRAHMARANPQAKAIVELCKEQETDVLQEDVLVLFNAPVHHYVSAGYWTETKPDTGKVVPTWNYAAVQVYGRLRVFHENDDTTSQFLQSQIEQLSLQGEKTVGGKWTVSEAPVPYIDMMKKAIIGIEIEIKRIEGRFKLSQEVSDGDWKGVVRGYRTLGTDRSEVMANMVKSRGEARGISDAELEPVKKKGWWG